MGHTKNLIGAIVFDGRDVWITAYAGWYHHFLAMQPVPDRIAIDWAHRMTEAVLLDFHLRDDKELIRQAALRLPAPESIPAPAIASPCALVQTPIPDSTRAQAPANAKSSQLSLMLP
ncbi:hypothetical protein ACSSZE_03155 [Acidithiobacillus caldus]